MQHFKAISSGLTSLLC